MAKDKHQSDQHYMEEQLAESQQSAQYMEKDPLPAEQYSNPESMRVNKTTTHKGRKSQTKGYQG